MQFLSVLFVALGGLLFVALATLYGGWAGAFVITKLWSWYIMPAFGVGALQMIYAYGIALLVGFLSHQHYSHYDKDERELKTKVAEVAGVMAYPWLVLLLGWAAKSLFM